MSPITPLDVLGLADLDGRAPADLFPARKPLELEIGCGRGDFLMGRAPANPGTGFIGVERNLPIIRRAANKMRPWTHGNVRLVHADIVHLLADWFPPAGLSAVHLYFPDPWPKKRHVKRRFFTAANMALVERALEPGGFFHLRTDHERYFGEMMEVMAAMPQFQGIPVPEAVSVHRTAFELRFVRLGQPVFLRSYRLDTGRSDGR